MLDTMLDSDSVDFKLMPHERTSGLTYFRPADISPMDTSTFFLDSGAESDDSGIVHSFSDNNFFAPGKNLFEEESVIQNDVYLTFCEDKLPKDVKVDLSLVKTEIEDHSDDEDNSEDESSSSGCSDESSDSESECSGDDVESRFGEFEMQHVLMQCIFCFCFLLSNKYILFDIYLF